MSYSNNTSFEYENESIGTPVPNVINNVRTKSTGSFYVKFISILIILLSAFQMLCSAKSYDISYDGSWWAGMLCCISGLITIIADSRRETMPWYYNAIRIMSVFACIAGIANDSKYRTMSKLNTCMSSSTGAVYGSTLHLDHATLCLEKHSSQDCVCVMHESVYCSTHNLNNSNNCGVFLNTIPTLLLISMISCVSLLLLIIIQSCCLRRTITRTTARFVPRRIPLWEIAVSSLSFESTSDDHNDSNSNSSSHSDIPHTSTTTSIGNTTMDNVRRSRYAYTLAKSSSKKTTSSTGTTSAATIPSSSEHKEEDCIHNTTTHDDTTTTPPSTMLAEEGRLAEDVELGPPMQYPTQVKVVQARAVTIQPVSVRAFPIDI